jgi:hypothetical protein
VEIRERLSQLTRLNFDNIAIEITSDGQAFAASLDGRAYEVELIDAADGRFE